MLLPSLVSLADGVDVGDAVAAVVTTVGAVGDEVSGPTVPDGKASEVTEKKQRPITFPPFVHNYVHANVHV